MTMSWNVSTTPNVHFSLLILFEFNLFESSVCRLSNMKPSWNELYYQKVIWGISVSANRNHRCSTWMKDEICSFLFLFFFFKFLFGPRSILWSHWLLLFWTSCVLPHGFQIQSGYLACTLSYLILKVTTGATPTFSTNRGVHCISVYTAWLARLLSFLFLLPDLNERWDLFISVSTAWPGWKMRFVYFCFYCLTWMKDEICLFLFLLLDLNERPDLFIFVSTTWPWWKTRFVHLWFYYLTWMKDEICLFLFLLPDLNERRDLFIFRKKNDPYVVMLYWFLDLELFWNQ